MNTARANMPHYFAAEKVARNLVEAQKQADENLNEGRANPLVAYFINQLCPDTERHEITGAQ